MMSTLSQLFGFLKRWQVVLALITLVAITMRLIPQLRFGVWGNDFGIYYGLTKTFLETGEFFNPYYGWGSSYNQFPILYVLTAGVHMLTGWDVLFIMPRLIPIFGGLCVFVFYFIAYELTSDRLKSLLAAGLLSVLPFHVYQTAHVAPLTLAHFFFALSLLFFIRVRRSHWYALPLVVSTAFLVMTHHLTTYMYVVSLIFIIFSENATRTQWTKSFRFDVTYLLLTSAGMFVYWFVVARTVFEGFMVGGLGLGSIGSFGTVMMYFLGLFALFVLIVLKRRLGIYTKIVPLRPERCRHLFFISLVVLSGIVVAFSFLPFPWEKTAYSLSLTTLPWALPIIVVISFAVAGFSTTRFMKNGMFIRGWLMGLVLSLVATTLLGSAMEYHRHFEYLMLPVSLIAVHGIWLFIKDVDFSSLKRLDSLNRRILSRDIIYIAIIVVLIVGNGGSTYPSYQTAITYHEDITDDNFEAVFWFVENVSVNGTCVASDHRIERIVEAYGFNTTHNNMSEFWNTTSNKALLEHNISYVILDSYMVDPKNGVFSYPLHYYMTNDSIEKFSHAPFVSMFRNETLDEEGLVDHWTEIYWVNLSYLQRQYDW